MARARTFFADGRRFAVELVSKPVARVVPGANHFKRLSRDVDYELDYADCLKTGMSSKKRFVFGVMLNYEERLEKGMRGGVPHHAGAGGSPSLVWRTQIRTSASGHVVVGKGSRR